ncbi:MAG: glycolate oxidase [Clostridia bacterium]|nr:glycolate oxidase [Clostridia bacterium]
MDSFLQDLLGERITDDWWERVIYGRDLAEVPGFMLRLLGLETVPDLVARPVSTEETAALVKYAADKGMAITPRGSGSSAFFNSVPVKRGLTLDLSGLKGVEDLDTGRGEVTVKAGTRWLDLDRELRGQGWAVKSYPTSAPTATVGGWLNMEGYGIGSLYYGPLKDQIIRLEVVLADGTVKEITRETTPPVSWFAGCDGTLGIVTRVTLSIRPVPVAEGHWLLSFSTVDSLGQAARELAAAPVRPYHLSYLSSTYFGFLSQLGYQVPPGEILEVAYEGDEISVKAGQEAVADVAGKFGAVILPAEMAAHKWEERFYHMRLKRLGPTLMAAEDWLPIHNLGVYYNNLQLLGRQLKTRFYSYGTIVDPERMTVFTGYRADVRQGFRYLVAMAVTGKLHTLARRLGGHPYSIGLWNTPYLPSIYSRKELAAARGRKQQLDPKGLLNPGKHYSYPTLLPPWLFAWGTNIASWLQRFTGPGEWE